jgi:hypothetical protein
MLALQLPKLLWQRIPAVPLTDASQIHCSTQEVRCALSTSIPLLCCALLCCSLGVGYA